MGAATCSSVLLLLMLPVVLLLALTLALVLVLVCCIAGGGAIRTQLLGSNIRTHSTPCMYEKTGRCGSEREVKCGSAWDKVDKLDGAVTKSRQDDDGRQICCWLLAAGLSV